MSGFRATDDGKIEKKKRNLVQNRNKARVSITLNIAFRHNPSLNTLAQIVEIVAILQDFLCKFIAYLFIFLSAICTNKRGSFANTGLILIVL